MALSDFSSSVLQGAGVNNPTSLQFGPDGRLYVSEQDGDIKVFTVSVDASSNWSASLDETITLVKDIANHNDDGWLNSGMSRR